MQTVSIPEMIDFVCDIAIRMNEPVIAWGEPGVGKSQGMAQATKQAPKRFPSLFKTSELVDIRLSQYDSVDMRGIPTAEKGLTTWNPPSTLPFKGNKRFKDSATHLIVLFLDEITSAQDSVSAVGYQLVNDRRVGEHELMDNVRIVAAANRDGDKGITRKMATPLCNRFTHIEAVTSVEAVSGHFQDIGLPQEGIAFLNFRKPLLSTFMVMEDGKLVVTKHKAFATPRTWEKALRYFADTTMSQKVKLAAMAGAVGDGPAGEFWGFVDVYSKIKDIVPNVIKNPDKVDVPDESSLRYAVTVALSGHITLKNSANVCRFMNRFDTEFQLLLWMLATKRDEELYTAPEYIVFAKNNKAVFA